MLTVAERRRARGRTAQDESERRWFARYIESEGHTPLTKEEKLAAYAMMARSEVRSARFKLASRSAEC